MNIEQIYADRVASGELNADPAQQAILPLFQDICDGLAAAPVRGGFLGLRKVQAETPKGLYLWGGVGRGKSMLMDLFVDGLGDIPKRRVHFHAFMQDVHAGMHEARQKGIEDALKPVADAVAKDVRVLAFDEMQITDITDAMIVGRLFDMLFAANVVVVTTSNRVPDDLYKDGLNRNLFVPFIEEIKNRMKVHEIVSPTDYRQDRLSGSEVYFTPINADARAAIDAVWNDLAGGDVAPLTLTVNKRDVVLPKFSNGVARAGFHDLCGRMLGAADYLAIAETVKVLILENVPSLGRTNFSEAKRFVTLVDALYEAGTRLIVSAEASPEMLYLEGEGAFEFERTASRLREMQDANWGS